MSSLDGTGPRLDSSEYPSQSSYANGALMCTSAAVFWALSCVCDIVRPMCSAAQMRLLMQTASATHAAVSRRGGASAEHTLQQHEVLLNIDKPCSVKAEEMYGYCGDKTPEMDAFVHVSDLYSLLRPGDALLLTGAGHTTALFRDARKDLYAFDSMPACVARVASAAALATALLASHQGMQQFTATILTNTEH